MKKLNITLGCDPELFLENSRNEIVSAEGLIGGTKDKPKPISDKGHSVQEDNVMVEFNIPPSNTVEEFTSNINFVKDYLVKTAAEYELTLNYSASAFLDKKYLGTKQAKTFGCEPDWNVYTRDYNEAPSKTIALRSCGGHIHIGYPNPTTEQTDKIVRTMDMFLGLPSVWLDPDTRRRRMYGKAGSFRFKPFGVEYRVLSNFWVKDDESIKWAYEETIKAVKVALTCEDLCSEEQAAQIRTAINESDVESAKELYNTITEALERITKENKITL